MNFCVENDLNLFEFHDSVFSYVHFDGKDLVVSASMVNIHKDTLQNPSDYDMEIASAQITFKNFHSATYEPGRAWKTGEDGKSYPVAPRVVFSDQDAIDRILEELRNEITVYHFVKEENCGYSIGGCGIVPYFEIGFDFDCVVICWDEYKKKAWYELHRQYRYDAVLQTANGDETVKLLVGCHEDPAYFEDSQTVNVGCTFEGKEYWGHGSDYLWEDAFADLQKKLPDGVHIKCCLTCRHGNECPIGNEPGVFFCTKDVLITEKSDLFHYTEDPTERQKRRRDATAVCDGYQPQTEQYYTYSNYLHYLNKN